jgi:hypothetical protein
MEGLRRRAPFIIVVLRLGARAVHGSRPMSNQKKGGDPLSIDFPVLDLARASDRRIGTQPI